MFRHVSAVFLILWVLCPMPVGAAEVCATNLDELSQTARLKQVQALFGKQTSLGLVNETKGSYLKIEALGGKLTLTFYTSGIFDLYPVMKEGPLIFCDTGSSIHLHGIGRDEELAISDDGSIKIGSGGPRMLFRAGAMPGPLKVLHHIVDRSIASPR